MRKPTFCICENKDADQLRGNREADQRLCFRYTDSAIPPLSKSEIFKSLAIFCGCAAWFVSDQVGNQNVGFLMTRLNYFHILGAFHPADGSPKSASSDAEFPAWGTGYASSQHTWHPWVSPDAASPTPSTRGPGLCTPHRQCKTRV